MVVAQLTLQSTKQECLGEISELRSYCVARELPLLDFFFGEAVRRYEHSA